MRAIRVREFGGPGVLRLEDVPEPFPGKGQVLVQVAAAGVNPVDTYIRTGTYAIRPSLPYTPGIDASGTIKAADPSVRQFKPGDRVYVLSRTAGTYAERLVCDASEAHPLPTNVSFAQGAAVGVPCVTAYRALFVKGEAQPGQTVLVHGASGGVGLAAVQFARARGITVIGTAGTEPAMKLVRDQGALHVLNHRTPGYLDQVMAITDGRGADIIVEMLANVNLDHDLDVLARRGRVIVVGNRGRVEIDPRKLMTRDASIIGLTLWNASPEELAEIHKLTVAGLGDGTVNPIIGREFPLADAARAHEAIMQPGAYGKIALIP